MNNATSLIALAVCLISFGASAGTPSAPADKSPPPKKAEPCLADAGDCSSQDSRPVEPCLAGKGKCDQSYQVERAAPKGKPAAAQPGAPADGERGR